MENAVNASTAGSSGQIVVAGAGYAGLHVALRLTAKLRNNPAVELTLVDRHDYHQVITELPRVAGGTRAADAVRIPLQDMLANGSTSSRPRSMVSTWPAGGCSPGPGRSAGRGWCWRSAAGPTTSPSPAWPNARCRCTRPATPSKCGRRSTKRSRLPRPPPTPSRSAAWRPWWSAAAAPPGSNWPANWPRCCPKWPAASAWRPTCPPWCLLRPAPPSWPAPHLS